VKRILLILKWTFRSVAISFEMLLFAFHVLFLWILIVAQIPEPEVPEMHIGKRRQIAPNHYVLGKNYLKKNDFGIWEMYIEGAPYERGLIYGELAQELIQRQEDIFVAQINQFVPGEFLQQFLRLLIGFFNADLPANIPLENQQEILGVSRYFSDRYDYIADKYTRILNYHAAHDIGHALNDYSIVGCTSFAIKGKKTQKGELLIGRNFDFYVGDEFAEDKLVVFVKPDRGYSFASYSWAGFTGVASGLNSQGVSVTINASKSDLPTSAKMPISILAREILQYASTMDEAIAIAHKRKIFVSETIMVGSAKDGKAVLIEKSPTRMGVFYQHNDALVCANHYQSNTFKKDKKNLENIRESDSHFRFDRVNELLNQKQSLNHLQILGILRDQHGLNSDTLGMGNPRAINQLIAHHSVLISPETGTFFVSTNDFQLGKFIGYDLRKTFERREGVISEVLQEDEFVHNKGYQKFLAFKRVKQKIGRYLLFGGNLHLSNETISRFISNNRESYVTYEMLGKYFKKKGQKKRAYDYFKRALTKNVASKNTRKELRHLMATCATN
jgi:isopenicillin-N N-acyltransferase-like protein